MNIEVKDVDKIQKSVEVLFEREKIQATEERIYRDLRKNANIKGFRKGKIPTSILNLYFRDFIKEELKRRIVEESIEEVLKKTGLEPLSEPEIEYIEMDGLKGYKLFFEILPEIEIPEYKELEVEVDPLVVKEEEIEERLKNLQIMHAELVPKDGPVESGNFVIVKYQGFLEGVELEEVRSEAYPLEVGSNTLLPEFENALLNMKKGEEKEIEIDFPSDYPDRNYASKRIKFQIQLIEVKEKRFPEIDDNFAKDLGFEDLSSLRRAIEEEIRKEKDSQRKNYLSQKLIEKIIEKNDIPFPEIYMRRRLEEIFENLKRDFEKENYTEEEKEVLKGKIERDLRERIKQEIVIANIAKKEGIEVEEKDVEESLKKLAEQTKKAYEEVKNLYETKGLMSSLKSRILEKKVLDFLIENSTIRERSA